MEATTKSKNTLTVFQEKLKDASAMLGVLSAYAYKSKIVFANEFLYETVAELRGYAEGALEAMGFGEDIEYEMSAIEERVQLVRETLASNPYVTSSSSVRRLLELACRILDEAQEDYKKL